MRPSLSAWELRAHGWAARLGQRGSERRDSRLHRLIDTCAVRYHQTFENLNYEMQQNGESRVLKILQTADPRCVFDVGANQGDWTTMVCQTLPQAHIHSFEVAPPTFEKLRQRVEGNTRVTANSFGLGAGRQTIVLHYVADADGQSSCVEVTHARPTAQIEVQIDRGDDYCAANNIARIDFLKADVEGMDGDVLKGFSQMLAGGAIRVVQFEYGFVSIAAHFLLRDFYEMLIPLGYRLGKIYPRTVRFKDYEWKDEDFIGPNYLAVHHSENDLVARLERG